MVHQLSYIENGSILIRNFHGTVQFSEIMESWIELIGHQKITDEIKGILNDFTGAELQMNINNLDQLMSTFMQYPDIFERIKLAVLMDTPKKIVLPILAEQKYPQFRIKAFSTYEAAIEWIKENDHNLMP